VPLTTGHWPLFPCHCSPPPPLTPHAPRQGSGFRPGTDLPRLATAIHRQPNWQRPNGTRSRRAVRAYSVCHRNSVCYRTRQFLRTNPSVSPRSPPPERRLFARGRRRSTPTRGSAHPLSGSKQTWVAAFAFGRSIAHLPRILCSTV